MRKSRKHKTLDAQRRRFFNSIINKAVKEISEDVDKSIIEKLTDTKNAGIVQW